MIFFILSFFENSTHSEVLCGLEYALSHHLNHNQMMKKTGDLEVIRQNYP